MTLGQRLFLEMQTRNARQAERLRVLITESFKRATTLPLSQAGAICASPLTAVGVVEPAVYGIRDIAVLGEACIKHLLDPATGKVKHRFIDCIIGLLHADPNYAPESLVIIILHMSALDFFLSGELFTRFK